jgi:sulfate transport system ATP-binding protein
VGSPAEVYEQPANAFVMGFVGPVAHVGGDLVRPHDISLAGEPDGVALEAMVERVTRLGFEVRVDLSLGDGAPLWVQVTRDEADALELAPGRIVWARPAAGRAMATA